MNKLYKLPLLLALVLTLPFASTAQIKIYLTPDNLPEVVKEIKFLGGPDIEISTASITSFLEANIAGAYNPELAAPEPSTAYADTKKITYKWKPIPGSKNKYSVRLLNLSDNSIYQDETSNTNSTLYCPNGFYLGAFQTKSKLERGPSFIIIEEKPLARNLVDESCECDNYELIVENQSIPDFNAQQVLIPTGTGSYDKVYKLIVNAEGPSSESLLVEYLLNIIVENGLITDVNMVSWQDYGPNICATNIDLYGPYIYGVNSYLASDFILSHFLRFTAYPVYDFRVATIQSNYSGTIDVYECTPGPKNIGNSIPPLRHAKKPFPNPTSDIINIPPAIHNAYDEFLLKNELGQLLILTPSNSSLDISSLPRGIYYLEAIGNKGKETFPISKID